MRKADISQPANVVPQAPDQGLTANEMPESVPHQDDSTAHNKSDPRFSKPPTTKSGPTPATNLILETLSAERDATSKEMNQIKQAKEALKSRERKLEAKSKDRKKRIQELNAPKSDQIWPVVQGILFGSALAFGVSVLRDCF